MKTPEGHWEVYKWFFKAFAVSAELSRSCNGEDITLSIGCVVPAWIKRRWLYYGDMLAIHVTFHAGI